MKQILNKTYGRNNFPMVAPQTMLDHHKPKHSTVWWRQFLQKIEIFGRIANYIRTRSSILDECLARSCSIYTDYEACNGLRGLPLHKNKQIVMLVLHPDSGLIKDTYQDLYHYSWWRAKDFDPLPLCIHATVSKG